MVLDTSWNETISQYGHKGVTAVHYAALTTGTINCILNLLIWITFHRSPQLLQKHHLYLFYIFAITNFFSGFFTIPTYFNLIYRNNLNCPRWSMMVGGKSVQSFEMACDRIRHIITLSIACERNYALFRPGDYFFLDHKMVSIKVCVVSLLWGLFDMAFLIVEDDLSAIRVHCVTTSSSGPIFHLYFLISTIAFGILLCCSYFTFICKLFVLRGTRLINLRSRSRENYQQVNSLTVAVILMVILFNVLPSTLYLYDMIMGEQRDTDSNQIVSSDEIRDYYKQHPEKMSKKGLHFLDRTIITGRNYTLIEYNKMIKDWLAENGTETRLLADVFGTNHRNSTNLEIKE
ncbi:unnamed protein product [Caenorhabditis bovis]|uniref:Uncharacterized protein n=1 Tax=Caenorhabditis bovis TaxID=2654633 RepID=A0A8S1ECP1_9PELO|nr:unnamed protein product [Caenorhabditis bovis]